MGKRGKEGVGKRGRKRKKGRLMEKTDSIDFTKNVEYIPMKAFLYYFIVSSAEDVLRNLRFIL